MNKNIHQKNTQPNEKFNLTLEDFGTEIAKDSKAQGMETKNQRKNPLGSIRTDLPFNPGE